MPLDRLRSVTDGTLQIAILEGTDVLYVERREGPGAIPVFRAVGARNAAYRTSSGKLLIAFLPAEERIRAIDSMKRCSRALPPGRSAGLLGNGVVTRPPFDPDMREIHAGDAERRDVEPVQGVNETGHIEGDVKDSETDVQEQGIQVESRFPKCLTGDGGPCSMVSQRQDQDTSRRHAIR